MPDESDTYQAQPSGDNVPNVDPSTHQQDGFFDHVSTEHQRNQPVNGIDSSVDAEKLRDARTRNSPTRDDQRDTYITTDGREAAEDGAEIQELKHSSSESEKDSDAISPIEEVNLKRLASSMRSQSYIQGRRPSTAATSAGPADTLERQATIAGLTLDDEVFDPKSPNFDFYKFIRMAMKILDEEGMTPKRAGIVFKDLNVRGNGDALNIQPDIGGWFTAPLRIGSLFRKKTPRHILRNFDGVVKSGELLIVLGRPGSGCSTLLKSMTGQLHGLSMDESSKIHYNGVEQGLVLKELKGEIIYNQEVDKHFPHLTVGETLEHAAALRMPKTLPSTGLSKQQAIEYITQIVMAVYGLSHTYNTKVGNDFVRGVSGGERKRVSIAEMALAGSALAAWDNSTRGLDSATALAFVKSLRLAANLNGSAHAVAIYQASQAIYDLFDKAVVLYEGREIFFGKANQAKKYFELMGWHCPPRQTTGDFLTSVTNPVERKALDGFEDKVPRTPDEFESYWRSSPEYADLQREISEYEEKYPVGGGSELQAFRDYKRANYAKHVRPKSPFAVGVPRQVSLNTKRAAQRIWNDPASTFTPIVINVIMALIIGSVFFDTPNATGSFTAKGAVLFFAVLLNALMSISEISNLYDQRPIVEKHKSYAFYHPYTEAFAGIVLDIPTKFMTAVAFNVVLYFLSGLRREPSQFFIFFLINYVTMFTMIAMFRTMAAITKTISQAMAISGVLILAIVVYTGFVVPVKYMHPWFSWIRYINPVYYAFEILIANEFHGRRFACSQFVPAYNGLSGNTFVCSQTGAVPGQLTVLGDDYIATAYSYYYSHVWRNFGILLGFLFAFMALYFVCVELNSETTSTAEALVFRRGYVPSYMDESSNTNVKDEERGEVEKRGAPEGSKDTTDDNFDVIAPQTDIFTWRDVDYDIEIKGEPRRLLDHVSGFVKPGTLTALMGTSGAGKTTLLDVLAQRTSMGVVSGSMLVNGAPLDSSFQRKTGYVQQQDLHLSTATVRESLRFSAVLRQPKTVSKEEKYAYVEEVIKMLNMEDFAEALVGVPGEGLNVEQRKLLSIGVELAAKPKLLVFLDEPTSGLDSQSSWAICSFLRKLADNGQAVLCTIHQPSAILFEQFDRLLFLRKGGKTVYFGNVGANSRTLLEYFERNGARKCESEENPAEYMLEVANDSNADWHEIWKNSSEAGGIQQEIDQIHQETASRNVNDDDPSAHSEFAMPFTTQLYEVTYRVFQQYWRMPSYVAAKMVLAGAAGLFIGFSFYNANASLQGMQNVVYSLFMVTTIFSTLVQQIMPLFVTQRSLYEVRERPSKAYSWAAFLTANVVVEIPYQIVAALIIYSTFYYPVVGIQSSERQGLVLLFLVIFFIYASTFAHMCIAALPDAQTAGAIVTLLFSMSLIFNGVMQPPSALPGFWIFMYRVSPLTYWVSGMASTLLHGRAVTCSEAELNIFQPPSGQTCGAYLQPYLSQAPGYLQNPQATSDCSYCSLRIADTFLAGSGIYWSDRWRNFGLIWVYVFFNIFVAVLTYYLFRVRPSKQASKTKKAKKGSKAVAQSGGTTEEKPKPPEDDLSDSEEPNSLRRRKSITDANISRTNTAGSGAVDYGLTTVRSVMSNYLTQNLQRTQSNTRNMQVY